jgi:hypothetical protein
LQPRRGWHYEEHRPITEKQILRRVSVSIFKISNFKEANKNLIILYDSKKLLKDHEDQTNSAYTEGTD